MGLLRIGILAVVIAAVVGLLLTGLLGPILVAMAIPIVATVCGFLAMWGWVLGILAGLWFFFKNAPGISLP